MNVALRTPRMTREQFLGWVERQEEPYEFDGFEPVAMTGGNRNRSRTCQNLYLAVGIRLRGGPCELLPKSGVATVGNAVRYLDASITCTAGPASDRLMPGVMVLFEVVSPTSGRIDRNIKLREYRAVPSIRRYVIVDNLGPDVTVFARTGGDEGWTADALTSGEVLRIPEVGIEVPVDELYRGVEFAKP